MSSWKGRSRGNHRSASKETHDTLGGQHRCVFSVEISRIVPGSVFMALCTRERPTVGGQWCASGDASAARLDRAAK